MLQFTYYPETRTPTKLVILDTIALCFSLISYTRPKTELHASEIHRRLSIAPAVIGMRIHAYRHGACDDLAMQHRGSRSPVGYYAFGRLGQTRHVCVSQILRGARFVYYSTYSSK